MEHGTTVLLSIFVAFLAAQVGAEIAQRLKMPSVVGQLAAGVIVGPSVLAWAEIHEPLRVLAEIGAVLLLFSVGLETRIAELKKVGKVALLVGVLGVIVPFMAGGAWAAAAGFDSYKAMFVAAAFVATSAGITAKVLQELGVISRIESQIILGAAIIDDVLAMLLLVVVSSLQSGTGFDFLRLGTTIVQALGFILLVVVVGRYVMKRSSNLMDAPVDPQSPLIISLVICLGLALAAAYIGLAAIIGAFLAGLILAETDHRSALQKESKPILAFVVPFFFVVTGMEVDMRMLASWDVLGTVLLVTLLAVAAKLVGASIGAASLGFKGAMAVGVGMVPRGEVGIIIASLGRQANVFGNTTYAVIIAMSLLTSVIAPPALKVLFKNEDAQPA
jgi:Kef-type K+ transport system membrane component KefB